MKITTEQAYFTIYKSLPYQIKTKLKVLIDKELEKETAFLKRLEEIEKMPKRPISELLDEIEQSAEKHMKENGITQKDIDKAVSELKKNRTAYKNKMRAKSK